MLERRGEDGLYEPALSGSRPIDLGDYRLLLSQTVEPDWASSPAPAPGAGDPPPRTFTWSATLRTGVRAESVLPGLLGVFRLRVSGSQLLPGAEAPYTLTSTPVTVLPAE